MKHLQSIFYILVLFTSLYLLRITLELNQYTLSLYENPLGWVLFIGIVIVVLVREVVTLTALEKVTMVNRVQKKSSQPHMDTIPWWLFGTFGLLLFAAIFLTVDPFFRLETPQDSPFSATSAKSSTSDKVTVNASTAQVLTDVTSLKRGKAIFNMYCSSCHAKDGGGGVGPNLTDSYWVNGGDMKNIFQTITEGGRSGKGMLPWKKTIKPNDIEKVASYVISLQGTSPKKPKPPQGDIWED